MNAPASRFSHDLATLRQIAADMLNHAKTLGATSAATDVSEGFGQSVSVRQHEVETIEYTRDKSVSISVFLGQRRGNASTSDFSPQALRDTVEAALNIARYTAEDECAGLPEAAEQAHDYADLDLYQPWTLEVDAAIELARDCEQAAYDTDSRISNSEGASVSLNEAQFVYADSHGFVGGYPTSRHSLSCAVIAGKDEAMQRDYWYSVARDAQDLLTAQEVGRIAAQRSVRRLNSRKLATMQVPVLFEAPIATSLLNHFAHAASGGSLYRKSSFLIDQQGQTIFSPKVRISDDPTLRKGLGSSPFDNEGVRTQPRNIVETGVLQGYFLSSYSARKLGLKTTGNAGGTHNLILHPGELDFDGLLKKMGRGLLVTELLGQGVNYITGDYSRGAAGFWVEDGHIQYAVEEITIAGNLKDIYRQITAVGNDLLVQGSRQCGSVLIENMTVAGQ